MNLIGLISSYKEGSLVQGAIRSVAPWCDHTFVYEGPAGPPIEGVPLSDFGEFDKRSERVTIHRGRWRTDARKRQEMLERTRRFEAPTWGVIVDADEVLFGGEYLRDWLQRLNYEEEINPDKTFLGKPMRLVELDGGVSWVQARLMRLDRMKQYEISTSVFVNDRGVREGRGNIRDRYSDWALPRTKYFEEDVMLVHPPIPTEPFLLHRSGLRHPVRNGLRMHEQEATEINRVKAAEGITE